MTNRIRRRQIRQPRPGAHQPGTLLQQLAAIGRYHQLPAYFRHHDPDGAWQISRWHTMPHVRWEGAR